MRREGCTDGAFAPRMSRGGPRDRPAALRRDQRGGPAWRPGALAALALAALPACAWIRTQMWPAPMASASEPLPPGDAKLHPPGPEEVTVQRHADPVRVRQAGSLSGYPMAFYAKRTRLTAGGSVIVAPGGRAEVLWPSGSSIVLFGKGVGWIGSPSRGEPIFAFSDIDRAKLELTPNDRVELLGGAVISGDSGPYMLDAGIDGTLRLRNQSEASVRLAFREEVFEIDPGQSVRIPLLSSGGAPRARELGLHPVSGPGFSLQVRGPLEVLPRASEVEVCAPAAPGDPEAPALLLGLGVEVRLAPGEAARLSGLVPPGASAPAGGT